MVIAVKSRPITTITIRIKSTKHSLFSIMTLKCINTSMIHYSTDSNGNDM